MRVVILVTRLETTAKVLVRCISSDSSRLVLRVTSLVRDRICRVWDVILLSVAVTRKSAVINLFEDRCRLLVVD